MKRLVAAAVALVLSAAGVAWALEETWTTDKNAANHPIRNLPAPTVATNPARAQDVAPGACIPKAPGANTLPFICSVPETDYITPAYTFGGDLSGTPASANVIKLRETSGPTHLTIGAWPDGSVGVRSGATIVGTNSIPLTSLATTSVANVAALEALAGSGYRDGGRVYVSSVQSDFVYHTSSSATVDHIVVASASGAAGARWIRDPNTNAYWWPATTWYLNPSTGVDEASGANSGAPIKTCAELGRRINGALLPSGTVTINVMTDVPQSDPCVFRGLASDGFTDAYIIGATTNVAAGRTVASPRNPAVTANDHFEITDAGGVSGFVQNYLIHRTSGTPAWAWGYSDRGSNKLQTSVPMTATGAKTTWGNGDTINYEDPVDLADLIVEPASTGGFVFWHLQTVRILGATNVGAPATGGGVIIDRSIIQNAGEVVFPVGIASPTLRNVMVPASAGGLSMTGGFSLIGGLYAGNGTSTGLFFSDGYSLGGSSAPLTLGGAYIDLSHNARYEKIVVMAYDWTGSSAVVNVSHMSDATITSMGGERNTGKLVAVDGESRIYGDANFTLWNPAITTDANPYNYSGTSYPFSQLGLATNKLVTRGSGIINTLGGAWAGDLVGDGLDPVVANDAISYAKMQNVSAASRLLGRGSAAGAGDPQELTIGAGLSLTGTVLSANTAVIDGDYGDITVSGSGTTWTIDPQAVTLPKIVNFITDSFPCRDTAGTGSLEVCAVGGGVEFTGGPGIQRSALTGDVTATAGSNATTIANNAVSNAKLRDSTALSLIGRNVNTSGDPADIAASAGSDCVYRENGSTIACGTVATAGITNDAITYAKIQNLATDRLLGRDSAGAGDAEEISVGGGIEFTGTVALQTSAFTGDVTKVAGGTALTIAANAVGDAKLRQSAGLSVMGRSAGTTGNVADITATTNGDVLRMASGALGWGAIPEASVTNLVTDLAGKLADPGNNGALYRTSSGVTAALNGTASAVPYFSATGVLGQDASNFGWDGTNHALNLAGGVAVSGEALRVGGAKAVRLTGSTAGGSGLTIENTSNAVGAYAPMTFANDAGKLANVYFTSSTYTGGDGAPNSLVMNTSGTAGSIILSPKNNRTLNLDGSDSTFERGNVYLSLSGTQLIEKRNGQVFIGTRDAFTAGIYTNNVNRATWDSSGNMTQAVLGVNGTTGMLYATAGVIKTAALPAADMALFSGGTTGTPTSYSRVMYDSAHDIFELSDDARQAWYGAGSLGTGTYQRVMQSFGGGTFALTSEAAGAAVVADIKIDAASAALILAGAVARVPALSAGGFVTATPGTGDLAVVPGPVSVTLPYLFFVSASGGTIADSYLLTNAQTPVAVGGTEYSYIGSQVATFAHGELCAYITNNGASTGGGFTITVVKNNTGGALTTLTFNPGNSGPGCNAFTISGAAAGDRFAVHVATNASVNPSTSSYGGQVVLNLFH